MNVLCAIKSRLFRNIIHIGMEFLDGFIYYDSTVGNYVHLTWAQTIISRCYDDYLGVSSSFLGAGLQNTIDIVETGLMII